MAKQYKDHLTKEQKTHAGLVQWLRWDGKYRKVNWIHCMNEGKRTKFEQFLWNVLGGKEGVSDFLFFAKRNGYVGLAIELKAEGVRVYKRDGTCNFPAQEKFLKDLEAEGWRASFQVGYDNAKAEIENYFS